MGRRVFFAIIVGSFFVFLLYSCGAQNGTSIKTTTTSSSTSTSVSLPPPLFTVTPYVSSAEVHLGGNWSPSHNGFHIMPIDDAHVAHIRAVCSGIFTKGKYHNETTGRWQVSTAIDYGSQYIIRYSFEPMGGVDDEAPADLQYNLLIPNDTLVSTGDVIGPLVVSGEAAHVCFGVSHNNQGYCTMPYYPAAVSAEILAVWRRTNSAEYPICTDHNLYY